MQIHFEPGVASGISTRYII